MVTPVEIGLLAAALLAVVVAFKLLRAITAIAINAIVGVVVLLIANFLGAGVEITAIAVLICAIGGVPGALLVILLAYLDVAFVGFAVAPFYPA